MARRKTNDDEGTTVESLGNPDDVGPPADDTGDPTVFEHDDANEVREGRLSAAQLSGGHGNVDPDNPDAQYPPGVVDNSAPIPANTDVDPASFVPTRTADEAPRTATATPSYTADYGTSSEE